VRPLTSSRLAASSGPPRSTPGGKGHLVDEATSFRMSRVRRAHTAPELRVRAILHRLRLRFRTINGDLPGSPDVANRRRRWAVYVHGCFWHGHRGCSRASVPKRNTAFWEAKLDANRRRDARVRSALRQRGYVVLTIWECSTLDADRVASHLKRHLMTRPVSHTSRISDRT
jgi:DNA mismatch endonuclease, patch repair protein